MPQNNRTLEHKFCAVLKTEHFGKDIKNTGKRLKCGAGEGWRRSVGPIVRTMKMYYVE